MLAGRKGGEGRVSLLNFEVEVWVWVLRKQSFKHETPLLQAAARGILLSVLEEGLVFQNLETESIG